MLRQPRAGGAFCLAVTSLIQDTSQFALTGSMFELPGTLTRLHLLEKKNPLADDE